MKISYNPITQNALTTCPSNNDIIFDLPALAIYAKGVKFLAANAPVANPTFNPTSISLSTNWLATGFYLNAENGFSNGLYAIKITSGNLIFSGVASVYVGKITVEDEIVLHMSGIPKVYSDGTQGRIYAKIAPSNNADYGEIYLSTNVEESDITNLSIIMKKIL